MIHVVKEVRVLSGMGLAGSIVPKRQGPERKWLDSAEMCPCGRLTWQLWGDRVVCSRGCWEREA